MQKKTGVLVVDDSAFMRKVISDMINSDPDLQVIAAARDGLEGIEKAEKLRPDVIIMDIEMPKMDGLSALEKITHQLKIPVIMFSSLTKEGAQITLNALEKGAFDFIPKPDNVYFGGLENAKSELVAKIKAAAKVNLQNLLHVPSCFQVPAFSPKSSVSQQNKLVKSAKLGFNKVIAIGTSTGGPRALQEVLPALPENIDAAILVVQHMPPNFTKSLAERLDGLSRIRVKEAEDGDELQAGMALIAPGNYHLIVGKKGNGLHCVELSTHEPVNGHRPSATVMMCSVAEHFSNKAIGVILTGMGTDGSDRMAEIKQRGGITIAEDESTCVVFGMPKAAIRKNAADYILPLPKIAEQLVKLV